MMNMENKINISEILKDCPSGMKLDCTMYEDVYFDCVDVNVIYCYIQHETNKTSITFNQFGTPNSDPKSKCVIFPKGKTTWEGFQRPFKDGDILFIESFCSWIFIYKENKDKKNIYKYLAVSTDTTDFLMFINDSPLCYKESISEIRFATEDEKQKLFDVIKANGYHWNDETKTLEKLVESKSKVGDYKYTITDKELCNLDYTICEWLLPRLKAFKEKTIGYPSTLNSPKEWYDILEKIILALELYNSDLLDNQERARSEQIKEGSELFSKYFRNLWW